nr:rep protein [Cressdnaviricota sp.]
MQPRSNSRSRNWVFTTNNYTHADEHKLRRLACKYIVFGRERAGTTGTRHLQGYVSFANAKKFHQVKALLPERSHIELRMGTSAQAAEYCKKDGDFEEFGEPPMELSDIQKLGGEASKVKWGEIHKLACAGGFTELADKFPKEWIQFKPRLESLYTPTTAPLDGELHHEWWVGPTGSGKSRALWDLYPNHFAKMINKWWDGYRHQDIVAIEEWSPDNSITAQSLKRWADRYPFTGEIKGGTMERIRPTKIIVLSNYTLEQCFPRSEDLQPLKRRFKVIEFPSGKDHATFRAAWFTNQPTTAEPMEIASNSDSSSDIPAWNQHLDLPDLDLDLLFSD